MHGSVLSSSVKSLQSPLLFSAFLPALVSTVSLAGEKVCSFQSKNIRTVVKNKVPKCSPVAEKHLPGPSPDFSRAPRPPGPAQEASWRRPERSPVDFTVGPVFRTGTPVLGSVRVGLRPQRREKPLRGRRPNFPATPEHSARLGVHSGSLQTGLGPPSRWGSRFGGDFGSSQRRFGLANRGSRREKPVSRTVFDFSRAPSTFLPTGEVVWECLQQSAGVPTVAPRPPWVPAGIRRLRIHQIRVQILKCTYLGNYRFAKQTDFFHCSYQPPP